MRHITWRLVGFALEAMYENFSQQLLINWMLNTTTANITQPVKTGRIIQFYNLSTAKSMPF